MLFRSDDSSSDSSSDDEQDDDVAADDLNALLKASQQAYKSRAPAPAAQSRFEDNQDVISFDAVTSGGQGLKRPGKALPLVVKAKHQMANSHPSAGKEQYDHPERLLMTAVDRTGSMGCGIDDLGFQQRLEGSRDHM